MEIYYLASQSTINKARMLKDSGDYKEALRILTNGSIKFKLTDVKMSAEIRREMGAKKFSKDLGLASVTNLMR